MKNKWRRISKRIVPLILVCSLTIGLIFGTNTKEVKAVVGVDDVAVIGLITALLLSYGYVTTQYFNDTDGANALADDWEEAYEEARFKVLNGGASGGDDGDNDDDDDKFEDTDGDGKITEKDIPKFEDFIKSDNRAFSITSNAGLLIAPIITKYILKEKGMLKNSDSSALFVKQKAMELLNNSGADLSSYPIHYEYIQHFSNSNGEFYEYRSMYAKNGYFYRHDGNHISFVFSGGCYAVNYDSDGSYSYCGESSSSGYTTGGFNLDLYKYLGCYPRVYESEADAKANSQRVDWVTPELQDTFDNQGNLELLPPYNPAYNYNMPTQEALQELLNNLNNSELAPDAQKQLVLDYINSLKTDVSTDPDTGGDTDPTPAPDPSPTPGGDSSGDSDKDTGSDEEPENNKFTADLKTLFPFCIPFDIVDCIKLFNAEPETPRIEVPMHFGIVNKDYTWVIDLKDFDSVALIFRTMFLIVFLIGLAITTSKVIKW